MKKAKPPKRGRPPGSDAASTRERILAAMERCLIAGEGSTQDVSNRAIARAAGITEMTLYRHFRTRTDLLRAFWAWLTARLGSPGMPTEEDQLTAWILPLFTGFSNHAGAARASLLSPEGIRMRQAMNAERQAAFFAALAEAGQGLPAQRLREAAAAVQLLHSGLAWMSMADFWDFDATTAARSAAAAVRAIIDDLRRQPRTTSAATPPLPRKVSP